MTARFENVAGTAGAEDWAHDAFGTAQGLLFDVASVLDMSDVAGDASPQPFERWGYQRAPFTVPSIDTVADRADDYSEGEWADDFTYGQVALASAVRDDELTQSDLIYAGDVLSKYVAVLKSHGRDY